MKAMKKFTLTVFCILAGCIFFLSGIWIYFQKSLDRVELGEGEHAASYQRHYLMISNDKDTGMWQSVYESASKEAEEKDAYVELLSPEQMNGYSQADCLKIGIASQEMCIRDRLWMMGQSPGRSPGWLHYQITAVCFRVITILCLML